MLIPEKINNFNIYDNNGERYLGVGETAELPKMEELTETMKGAGVLGEWQSTTKGHFGAMTLGLVFNTQSKHLTNTLESGNHVITLRASQQYHNSATGGKELKGMVVSFAGSSGGMGLGKVGVGTKSDCDVTFHITYLKLVIDGEVLLEWDLFNSIYTVNGEDQLADVRNHI